MTDDLIHCIQCDDDFDPVNMSEFPEICEACAESLWERAYDEDLGLDILMRGVVEVQAPGGSR